MAEEQADGGREELRNRTDFVVEQTRAGADEAAIVAGLEEQGVERGEARRLVETVQPVVLRAAEAERVTRPALVRGVAGGLVAAVVGGLVWGLIVIATEYEIGFAAWGIGFLAGFVVVGASGGRKGLPLQVTAVLASLLGILIGKYVAYAYFFMEAVRTEVGEAEADELSYLDADLIRFFLEDLDGVVTVYDLLWIALAVMTAWRIPRATGLAGRPPAG